MKKAIALGIISLSLATAASAQVKPISLYITRPAGPPVQVFFDKSH